MNAMLTAILIAACFTTASCTVTITGRGCDPCETTADCLGGGSFPLELECVNHVCTPCLGEEDGDGKGGGSQK
jgi:predicted small secreted protein